MLNERRASGDARPAAGQGQRLAWRWLAALSTAVLLAACGGGLSIGIGVDGEFDFSSPSISLAAAQASVQAGQAVTLVAAAADENGIESVEFYRQDDDRNVLLGADGSEPFQWQAIAPADGSTFLRVFARATDRAGNWTDSDTVTITITP